MQFTTLTFHTIESGPNAEALYEPNFARFALDLDSTACPEAGLAPLAGDADDLTISMDGSMVCRFAVSQRDIPPALKASAIRRAMAEESTRLGRAPAEHEASALRGRVTAALLERALPKMRAVYAGIDAAHGFWWMATTSGDMHQRFQNLMGRALQVPLTSTALSVPALESIMTDWVLHDTLPQPLAFGRSAVVADVDTQMKVAVRNADVTSKTVVDPLTPSSRVLSKLSLEFGDDVTFSLTAPLTLHRVRLETIPPAATDKSLSDAHNAWSEWVPHLRSIYKLFASLHASGVSKPSASPAPSLGFLPDFLTA